MKNLRFRQGLGHSIAAAAMALVSLFGPCSAQSVSGTFLGVVRDPSGAVVANATIVILNKETGFRRELNSTSSGDYEAPYIPTGLYNITARAPGFNTVDRAGINLQVDQKARVDFTLNVGEVAE